MSRLTLAVLGILAATPGPAAAAIPCGGLARLGLRDTRVDLAQLVPTGDFPVDSLARRFNPRWGGGPAVIKDLPAFCRVTADITPTADSDIRIEVWMPVSGWNGKLVGVGNGGWSGVIRYDELGPALRAGYAAAATNTGHDGSGVDASFALGHPEKLVDFGYRAVHDMTSDAKAVIVAFYGRQATRAYWDGCSTGGKQGLTEAQRFPLDYDGIIAGAPANNWTHLMAGDVWTAQATHASPAAYLSRADLALLHRAALAACDADDGVRDGVIGDPQHCRFDPGVLLCKVAGQAGCLTGPQVEAARKIYAGARNPRTGKQVYPGLEPGSEMQWIVMGGGQEPPIVASYFKYILFQDTAWDFRTLNFDGDVARADSHDARILNATDPDLGPFIARGGKLLLYHGWADGLIAPGNTVDYYESVVRTLGQERVRAAVRLFMIPGMGHCGGGAGAGRFDALAALDRWVASGKAPDRIVAAHGAGRYGTGPTATVDRTRPLCPYPQVARYTGSGSADDAVNFRCAAAGGR